jgi:hypothetical protein
VKTSDKAILYRVRDYYRFIKAMSGGHIVCFWAPSKAGHWTKGDDVLFCETEWYLNKHKN